MRKIFCYLFPIIVLLVTGIFIYNIQNYGVTPTYSLKSYKNTVALYENEEIIEVYSNIVLDTLPEKDRHAFKKGIQLNSPEEAMAIIEDYDG